MKDAPVNGEALKHLPDDNVRYEESNQAGSPSPQNRPMIHSVGGNHNAGDKAKKTEEYG